MIAIRSRAPGLRHRQRAIIVCAPQSSAPHNVPTIAESGVAGYETTAWWGIVAPAKTPAAIVGKLYTEIAKALQSPEVKGRLQEFGINVVGLAPGDFATFQKEEIAKLGKAIKDSGAKAE